MNTEKFPAFPLLQTSRLQLRKLKDEDKEEIFSLRTHPAVIEYVNRSLFNNEEEALTFIHERNEGNEEGEWFFWAIEEKRDKKLIGTICLWNFDRENSQAEVGYELHPSQQGIGLMSEALQAVSKHGFSSLGLESILAFTHQDNLNSIKLLLRHGFQLMPEVRDEDYPENLVFGKRNPLLNS